MSQEGANLPQEVEGSHDQDTAPHGSIPAGAGSPTATVMPAGSKPSSVSKLASAVDNAGLSERASPAEFSAGEDSNAVSSKIASPAVLQAGEDSSAASKIASAVVLLASEENKAEFELASPAMLLAGEEKDNDAARSKLASPALLHDCDNNKAGSHDGVDNNTTRSKLTNTVVLHAGDGNNDGSKIASLPMPQAIVDNTTGSKLDSPTVVPAGEDKNAEFKLANPAVLHASKDMNDNAVRRPKFTRPMLLHAGKNSKVRTKLAIVSHAGGNARSSRLTRSAAAALHAAKENASKLAIQVVPHPHAGEDNNTGSSKAATRAAAVDAGESNTKKGKNNIAGEQRAHEADVGGGSGKGKAAAVEDADPNLHVFTERERRKKMKNMFSTLHALLPQLPNKADKATIVGEAVTYIRTLEGTLQKLEEMKLQRKRALAAQQQLQQQGQQQLVVDAVSGSSRASSAHHHPAQARPAPAPAPAASSREANLADMVHSLAQQAAVAAANNSLALAAGAGGSGSSSGTAAAAATNALALPRGVVPFPAPAAGFQTWTGQNVVVSVANHEAYISLHCPRQPGTLTKVLFVLERHSIEVVTTTVSTEDGFRMYGIHARAHPPSASAPFPENLCAEDRFKLAVSEIVQLLNI